MSDAVTLQGVLTLWVGNELIGRGVILPQCSDVRGSSVLRDLLDPVNNTCDIKTVGNYDILSSETRGYSCWKLF